MVWWTAAFRWTDKPRLAIFAELLIDCEEDRTLSALLVGMLREADPRALGRTGSPRRHGEPAV
jgi:hypothetical protein